MTTTTGAADTLSSDERFDLLSNHRRRYVLHYFLQIQEQTTIRDLSEQIAAWENETTVEDLSYDQRKRVYTSLQQVHLPRLDDAGVVEFDSQEGIVTVGPAAEDLDIYLDGMEDEQVPWRHIYFGLALLNVGISGAVAAGVWPVAVLSGIGLPMLVTGSFLVTSLAHLYVDQAQRGATGKPPSLDQ